MAGFGDDGPSVAHEVKELAETVRALVAGLSQLTLTLGHHGEMLGEILRAVADREEEEESPLMTALAEIIGLSERHARSLDRIEDRLTQIERQGRKDTS